jgi:hypothetical protein
MALGLIDRYISDTGSIVDSGKQRKPNHANDNKPNYCFNP